MGEDRVDGHATVEDDRAEKSQAESDGDGLRGVEAAGEGDRGSHPAGEPRVRRQCAAGGDEAQVRDVDGRADQGSLGWIAQDQPDKEARDQGSVQREEGQAEEPRAVGEVVADGNECRLPRTDGDLLSAGRARGVA